MVVIPDVKAGPGDPARTAAAAVPPTPSGQPDRTVCSTQAVTVRRPSDAGSRAVPAAAGGVGAAALDSEVISTTIRPAFTVKAQCQARGRV